MAPYVTRWNPVAPKNPVGKVNRNSIECISNVGKMSISHLKIFQIYHHHRDERCDAPTMTKTDDCLHFPSYSFLLIERKRRQSVGVPGNNGANTHRNRSTEKLGNSAVSYSTVDTVSIHLFSEWEFACLNSPARSRCGIIASIHLADSALFIKRPNSVTYEMLSTKVASQQSITL